MFFSKALSGLLLVIAIGATSGESASLDQSAVYLLAFPGGSVRRKRRVVPKAKWQIMMLLLAAVIHSLCTKKKTLQGFICSIQSPRQ